MRGAVPQPGTHRHRPVDLVQTQTPAYSPTAALIFAVEPVPQPDGTDDRVPFQGDLDGVDLGGQCGEHLFDRLAADAHQFKRKSLISLSFLLSIGLA